MALTFSYSSYPPTMALFIAHWGITNAARPAPLVLKGGETVADMTTMRDGIETAISTVNLNVQTSKLASSDRKTQRAALRNRMMQFRKAADYWLEGLPYLKDVAALPNPNDSDTAYLHVADTMIFAWQKANTDGVVPDGLKLEGAYDLNFFRADVEALQSQPLGESNVILTTSGTRDSRDDLLLPARTLLKRYATAIRALYAPESVEVRTLPALWEKNEPNPDAPKLKVEYVAGSSTARASWNPIIDPTITRLYLNIAPGARYLEKNARRLFELTPDVTSSQLPQGTITPGSTNWVRLVAVDEDGKEVGSNSVKVARGV